jgi:ribonuclease T1
MMWIHMTRRVTICLALFFTCSVLLVRWPCEGSRQSQALADASSAATIEAPLAAMPDEAFRSQQALERRAPEKAYALLEALKQRHGAPLPGYVGGRLFHNREHRLPMGHYKEYDVNRRVSGRSRDAERIVVEQTTGKAYYTDDHYRTFLPLN